MEYITNDFLKNLNLIKKDSHKGQNGKLTIIGGSKLFHGASLWALTVASRIVDMVYYVSVKENQDLVKDLKKNLYAFIAVPQGKEEDYLRESDSILIGPGMVRGSKEYSGTGETGDQTRQTVLKFINLFPAKKWIIDAGALQALTPPEIQNLDSAIITPHPGEFKRLFDISLDDLSLEEKIKIVSQKSKQINKIIVLKGKVDIISSPNQTLLNKTGNEGMTKGGTGDVLAGLIAALSTTNDLFIAASVGAYINGLAGDELYKTFGPYFNADQLALQVPKTLWKSLTQ
jgi:hydroxyethylthiazole kinase-like uncharacterized protein yjeF